ncbi:FtsK/SpoIIIE domain-containing protein [Pseudonocardia ailaonensis]|uniref:FtsK/SpoIIIE domain-containing protein n=1 Tax=Pseudonocardia ailaonensis TaxID=367279 RepID=UPI0031E34CCC
MDLAERALHVRLEPGMTVGDVRGLAPRIAPYLGAWGLRVEPIGNGASVVVTLLQADPLGTGPLPCPDAGPVLIGVDESGSRLIVDDPSSIGHAVIVGQSGSGKSGFLYALLSAYARYKRAGYPIRVDGIDPSGILLRPFPGSVLGFADPGAVEEYLTRAVAEMDDRISRIPANADELPQGYDYPLRVVTVEEYPAVLRYLDAIDPKMGKRIRALVARLLSESRKAGMRVILVAQRADASLIGGFERAQCSFRLSYRSDPDAVKMLHDADPSVIAEHSRALPGIGLLSVPGRSLIRVRTPWLAGEYAEYVRRVNK